MTEDPMTEDPMTGDPMDEDFDQRDDDRDRRLVEDSSVGMAMRSRCTW